MKFIDKEKRESGKGLENTLGGVDCKMDCLPQEMSHAYHAVDVQPVSWVGFSTGKISVENHNPVMV
jgi:hypothetical protein